MAAFANAPTTTPAMSSTRGSARIPLARAMPSTRKTAASAPAKAASDRNVGSPRPTAIASTAPTAAPPDTPSRYGSASGVAERALQHAAAHA